MIFRITFIALILAYVCIIPPFTGYLQQRPVMVKLGYVPDGRIVRIAMADYRNLLAQYAVTKVLFYYGTVTDSKVRQKKQSPEYFNMFRTMQQAVRLDPYNLDAYYFTQAAFTWELKKIKEVNDLLDYGMEYRTWDHQLPFFAGFNAAYFLKDYALAARYMQKAAELSGEPLFTTLAARYFYEADQTNFGLLFLDTMVAGAKDEKVKKVYLIRKEALQAVKLIAAARDDFRRDHGRLPADLAELLQSRHLTRIPRDPYGGTFYLDADGSVRSSSKFTFNTDVKP